MRKTIGKIVLIGSSLLSMIPYVVNAQNSRDEIAYQIFDKIMSENPVALNDAHKNSLKRENATTLVYLLADTIGNRDGIASKQEIRDALDALNRVSHKIADKYAGNRDGEGDIYEMEALRKMRDPAFQEIMEMQLKSIYK